MKIEITINGKEVNVNVNGNLKTNNDELYTVKVIDDTTDKVMQDIKVKQIVCGYGYTFIITRDEGLLSTGDNKCGQLGLEDIDDRSIFTKIN